MPKTKIQQGPQTGTCRLCSQPCENTGHGWYHLGRPLGTVRGIWPHFASPMAQAAA